MAFRVYSVARRVSRPQPSLMHYGSQHQLGNCTSSSPLFNRLIQPPNSRVKFIHDSPIERFEVVRSRMKPRFEEVRCALQDFEAMSTEFHATSAKLKESLCSELRIHQAFVNKYKLSRTYLYGTGIAFFCLGFFL